MNYRLEEVADELMLEVEDLKEILEVYFEEAEEILLECETAWEASDIVSLSKLFHTFKGSAANFRMHDLSDLAVLLEKAAKEANLTEVKSLLMNLRKKYDQIKEYVKGL